MAKVEYPEQGISPLRKLLLAVLISVVLFQIAAMALVARSQVQRAELRAAAESAARTPVTQVSSRAPAERSDVMTVGYAPQR